MQIDAQMIQELLNSCPLKDRGHNLRLCLSAGLTMAHVDIEHRPPVTTQAKINLEQRYSADVARSLVHDNPQAIFRS
ncbi:MAG: hypothetical protein R3E87_20475 [Burkholderiaceae bacterium]